jgi:3-phenylpropionate/cinnamic acid dioxygenase small subunit
MTASISPALQREIEAFLYVEARMLEDNRFDDWLGCFTSDVHYLMPVRQSTDPGSGSAIADDAFCLFDDDRKSLELRVLRIKTGDAHAELPPSVTCRLITNVSPEPDSHADEAWIVRSNFMVYQERRNQHGVLFYGRREDLFRLVDGKLKIAKRRIDLAQAILPTTISIFF